jgi:hypothetical protein
MRRCMRQVGGLHCLLQLEEACKDSVVGERNLMFTLVGIGEISESEC